MNSAFHNIQELRTLSDIRSPFMRQLFAFATFHKVALFLVGGSVRDLLLNRRTTDIDFTLQSGTLTFVRMFADSIKAPFIALEENPPTARVIVSPPDNVASQFQLDFTEFRGETLTDDLRLRDLTINAMAIPLEAIMESDNPEVIDPCDGQSDLSSRLLRFPSEQVIVDDPLRMMRIFRFAAQLDFEIAGVSLEQIQNRQHLLPNVSQERIRDELLKTLNVEKSAPHLKNMCKAGLIRQVFPTVNILSDYWDMLDYFETYPIPESLDSHRDEISIYLNEEMELLAHRKSLIKLCILFQDSVKDIGNLLKLSRKSVQFMKSLVSGHQFLIDCDYTSNEIIDFLRDAVSDWRSILLFSTVIHPISYEKIHKIVDIYYNHLLPILKQGRLLTGKDLIRDFDLKEGKEIGILLKQVEKRQFYGEIRTREEAIQTVADLMRKQRV